MGASRLATATFASLLLSCHRGDPPTWSGDAAATPSAQPIAPPTAREPHAADGDATDAHAPSGEHDGADAAAGEREGSLAQTRDRPSDESPALDARGRALFDAIVHDEPDRALGAFFPRAAYLQVKDVGDPARDWKHRLVAAFARDIHELHRALGPSPEGASYRGLAIPAGRARWVEPGDEYNKLGYYRVYGTRLRYARGSRELAFDVKSLISWRGEWYVVHLSSFK